MKNNEKKVVSTIADEAKDLLSGIKQDSNLNFKELRARAASLADLKGISNKQILQDYGQMEFQLFDLGLSSKKLDALIDEIEQEEIQIIKEVKK